MAKIIDSENCDQPGILSKIDRLCRRILPGYNYIRNRRSGSRDSLEARKVCSGFLIPARFRGNRGKNRDSAEITDEIYLGAGISKSEFCKTLEELLRKKLIVMQERMKQEDFFYEDYDVAPSMEKEEHEHDESLVVRPLVSPEVRQRMIQAMIHQSGRTTPGMDNLQEMASQETHQDERHPSSWEQTKRSTQTDSKVPSDDIQLKEIEVEEPEAETETETEPERAATPNSLLDYFLS